ncbi:hypothetical protein N602_28415 [Mycobacterium avium subsp. hominissuis 10-5606]|nr:hypothetical protein N602_28415 [Mycobacterium avium subsp. hominissuis 10-5606]
MGAEQRRQHLGVTLSAERSVMGRARLVIGFLFVEQCDS